MRQNMVLIEPSCRKTQKDSCSILSNIVGPCPPARATTAYSKTAILGFAKKFHIHLACGAFTIYADHRSLAYLMTMKNPMRRVALWLVILGEYWFAAVCREDKLNVVPDALLRLPSTNVIAGTGSLVLNDFREEDYIESCFQFPVVSLLADGTISTLV